MSEEVKRLPEPVVGVLIYNDKGEIFLVKNPSKWGEVWLIPGGHINLGETAIQAAQREVLEETGLEITDLEPISFAEGINPPDFHEPRHFIYLNHLAALAGGKETLSDEMTEFIWVNPTDLGQLVIKDSVRPLIEYYLDKKRDTDESWEHKYKRALADYQNLLKQQAKEKDEFIKYALSDFLHDILPVYDYLKMSLQGLNEEENNNSWVEGVRHVLKQFRDVLVARGVEEIKTVGEDFDHDIMEAIDGRGEKVKQEVSPGYKLNGRLLRAAKVIVTEAKENKGEKEEPAAQDGKTAHKED